MAVLTKNYANASILLLMGRSLAELLAASHKAVENDNYKTLDILHHLTAGVKAYASELQYNGLDELRQTCGGAGFLLTSGLASWWAEGAPTPTYEGVNVLMYQQSAKLLFKNCQKALQGKKLSDFFAYLGTADALLAKSKTAEHDFSDLGFLEDALAFRAASNALELHQAI